MKEYKIVKVNFPFSDENKVKSRPFILLSKPKGRYNLVVIGYMTSSDQEILDSDIILDTKDESFAKTGLAIKTIIKLHRLENLSIDDIQGEIGFLSQEKSLEIKQKLKLLLELN